MAIAVRSYIALFSGPLISIPDWAFAAYLAIPLLLLPVVMRGAVTGLRRAARRPPPGGRPRLHHLLWLALAGTFLLNIVLFLLNNINSVTPHGRLFFITLAASHALFAGALAGGIRRLPRRRLTAAALTAILLGLFLWTAAYRLSLAVAPPRENLVALSPAVGQMTLGPIWAAPVSQPVQLPPGRLRGFRISLRQGNHLPQFGASIDGELLILPSNRAVPIPPVDIGDNDGTSRWIELPLAAAVDLVGETRVYVRLHGRAPRFSIGSASIDYQTTAISPESPRVGPLFGEGAPAGHSLCLSAVYE